MIFVEPYFSCRVTGATRVHEKTRTRCIRPHIDSRSLQQSSCKCGYVALCAPSIYLPFVKSFCRRVSALNSASATTLSRTPPPRLRTCALARRATRKYQVVDYFSLVHAAQTATPPPALANPAERAAAAAEGGSAPAASPPDSQGAALSGVGERGAPEAAGRGAVEAWRRKLLREMLRSELGFNTVVKDSGLPGGAGLGLFVEGTAPEGAVVAIYPVR